MFTYQVESGADWRATTGSDQCGGRLHEFLLGAFRAQNVIFVRDETFADKRVTAHVADEAVVVPVAALE